MIQVLDILGKEYREIKEFVTSLDFDEETLAQFDIAGFDPPIPILEGKLNKEFYFFNFQIEKHKVKFSKNRVSEVVFGTDYDETVLIIKYLISDTNFKFRYFSEELIDHTEFKDIGKSDNDEIQFKIKRLHFETERSEEFDIEKLKEYGILTFISDEMNIVMEHEILGDGSLIYIFTISKIGKTE
ncbi:hypothetical protein ACQWU4_02730 [Chryseobacterium sp. MIQD13]|uniref:hypothetical protein n=1 Tax=Chryseobacterium sp. MIQD13 TaxID=3422310 RepID=UPI003D272F10